ncbi:MAG: hypothetical protein HW416_1344 [Chloroflexi bacterium]|nr:hypothetical protein [Chloroflexota bacterium]
METQQASQVAPYADFVHTGPGTLAGRYLRGFWQPICLSAELPPSRAVPIRIMGEDFTLYRGQVTGDRLQGDRGQETGPRPSPLPEGEGTDGAGEGTSQLSTQHSVLSTAAPHLVAFRCAHRGTQLSTGWVEGDDLRCFYHGWKYNADGQCIEQPAEPEPFCSRIKIRSYPVQEYLGLIFAYLGDGQPPQPPRYKLFEREGPLKAVKQALGCNYFSRVDNSADPVHTKFVHRWPDYERYGLVGIPTISADEQPWGLSTYINWPGWPADEIDVHHLLMPNGLMNRIYNGDHLSWQVPIDDESHINFGVTREDVALDSSPAWRREAHANRGEGDAGARASEHGEAVLAGARSIADLMAPGGVSMTERFNLQDHIAQVGQGRVADRDAERLGRTDVGVALLRRLWLRELCAFAENQPVKRWMADEVGLKEWGGRGDR